MPFESVPLLCALSGGVIALSEPVLSLSGLAGGVMPSAPLPSLCALSGGVMALFESVPLCVFSPGVKPSGGVMLLKSAKPLS